MLGEQELSKVNRICELRKGARRKCNQTAFRRVPLPETSALGGLSPGPTLRCKPALAASPSPGQQQSGGAVGPKRRYSRAQSVSGCGNAVRSQPWVSAVRSDVLLHEEVVDTYP